MESFLTLYGLSNSGQEKLQFTPFGVVPSRAAQTDFVPELSKAITYFSLRSYPGEISHSNSPNRQLSNGARVIELYRNRNVDPSRSPCLKAIDRKIFERGNFLVLRPALLKIAYFNSGNRQLSIAVLPKELRQRKIVDPSRGTP